MGLSSWGSLRKSMRLSHGGSDRDGEGVWGFQHLHSDLGGLHSCLQLHPSGDASQRLCSSAETSQWPRPACKLSSSASFGSPDNWHYRPWSSFYPPAWAGRQIPSPTQQLSTVSVPPHQEAWPENPGSHGAHPTALLGRGAKPEALPTVEHSLWPCITKEPEQ